jgi:CheY-like chemotaxis protein
MKKRRISIQQSRLAYEFGSPHDKIELSQSSSRSTGVNNNTMSKPRSPYSSVVSAYTTCSLEHRQVLLLEDAPDDDRLYLNFLQRAGAEVTLECSGEAVLDSVMASTHRFDAIVMDVQTPNIDGVLVARTLRDGGFTGAIVALSKNGSSSERRRWLHAGCDSFLSKPLDAETLVRMVRVHTVAVPEESLSPLLTPANMESVSIGREMRGECC